MGAVWLGHLNKALPSCGVVEGGNGFRKESLAAPGRDAYERACCVNTGAAAFDGAPFHSQADQPAEQGKVISSLQAGTGL